MRHRGTSIEIGSRGALRWVGAIALFFSLSWALVAQSAPANVAGVVDALRMRRYGDALQQCAQLLKTDPESPKLWTLRGVALENTDRASEALESYKKALKIAPDYVPALEAAAQLEYKAQSDNALPLLRRIVQIQPENPTAHAMLGVVEHRMQQYAECAQDFEHAGDLTHSQPGALMANALCLAHLNRAPE